MFHHIRPAGINLLAWPSTAGVVRMWVLIKGVDNFKKLLTLEIKACLNAT